MSNGIFVWNVPSVADHPQDFVRVILGLGCDEVWIKGLDGYKTHVPSNRPDFGDNLKRDLVEALHAARVRCLGWSFNYGAYPDLEGRAAGELCAALGLDGWVFDVESAFDAQPSALARVELLFREFNRLANGIRTGFCWWARYRSASGAAWHPVEVLRRGMELADFGAPMMYWSGKGAAAAVSLFDASLLQWREITSKPLVAVGRAYNGDGGEMDAEGMRAFYRRAVSSGLSVSWWVLDQLRYSDLMRVFAELGEQPADTPALFRIVSENAMNVRSSPSIRSSVIGRVSPGEVLDVLDVSGGDVWVKTRRGWVCMQKEGKRYLEVDRG